MEEGFDLLLGDGRVAALAGIAANPATPGAAEFRARLNGARVRIAPLSDKPDRWGRTPAAVFFDGRDNLAEKILASGLARYRPDTAAKPCRDRLLAAEQAARAAGRGLWATPGALLDAADTKAILAAPKGMLAIEGRVLSIGERRGRLYLNFGARRTTDFTIVISKRNLALFEAAQLPLRQARGWRLRVRGLIDRGFGPMMEIAGPDALEVVERAGTAEARQ